jgi:TPP-dependent pyruvate/acetoin dehydrogenase alpha subunit
MSYDPTELKADYLRMLVIRAFEQAVDDLFAKGGISGTSHLCTGQEACAVGATAALRPDDLVTSNHRGHGHFIAKGAEPRRLMAELFGKAAGYSGGRGGSQHMADFSIGFLGSNGITAGMTPIAVGAALSQKLLETGRVVLCFFGDGATGQGAFHEAVNMAATWELPVVFLCENNLYAMSTPVAEAFKEPSVARRVAGYGMPTQQVDGNDYFGVRQATAAAVEVARCGEGPTLIEAMTYRHCGHSKSDQCEYRPDAEEEEWLRRDPIGLMRERMLAEGVATEDELEVLQGEAEAQIEEAVLFADSSPDPDPATVAEGLFVGF